MNQKILIIIGAIIVAVIMMRPIEKEGKKQACQSTTLTIEPYQLSNYYNTWMYYPDDYIGQSFISTISGYLQGGQINTEKFQNNADYSVSVSTTQNGPPITNGYLETVAVTRFGNTREYRDFTFPNNGPAITSGQTYYITFKMLANGEPMRFMSDSRGGYPDGRAYCSGSDCIGNYGAGIIDLMMDLYLAPAECPPDCSSLKSTLMSSANAWIQNPSSTNKINLMSNAINWIVSC